MFLSLLLADEAEKGQVICAGPQDEEMKDQDVSRGLSVSESRDHFLCHRAISKLMLRTQVQGPFQVPCLGAPREGLRNVFNKREGNSFSSRSLGKLPDGIW